MTCADAVMKNQSRIDVYHASNGPIVEEFQYLRNNSLRRPNQDGASVTVKVDAMEAPN